MLRFDELPEGRRLRLSRVAVGLTLFDVGRRADISPPRLSEHERGVRALPADAAARVRAVLDRAEGEAAGGSDAAA